MGIEFLQQRRTASDIGAWLDLEPVDNDLSQVAWSNHRSFKVSEPELTNTVSFSLRTISGVLSLGKSSEKASKIMLILLNFIKP
ncbi:hypothetical protein P5673_007471 [Acropora cervicornis]|uniref:Uncharacterized protein n=1 Tax=Acropora cervicornis TaxID=6130 RepID=A0AAD9QW68_ACRCE|nr:hypothetical protein P5673_007471 [Acropora cervicornis]